MILRVGQLLVLVLFVGACGSAAQVEAESGELSAAATATAEYALREYRQEIIGTLARLVSFETVHRPGMPNAENPEFRKLTAFLREKAAELGLEFQDHGAVVVLALGDRDDRLGVVTHADVQPADASKWARNPFELDLESRPGRLVGRGTEDDKGPLAIAMYAMKAIADQDLSLKRRIELIISYTEESDWAPMTEFLQTYQPPQLNIALDNKFPVVTAEKGFCLVQLALPLAVEDSGRTPRLASFVGGSFVSQIPEDARATIVGADAVLEESLSAKAGEYPQVDFSFERQDGRLVIGARGKSAHSSEPEAGVNAIAHLAVLLNQFELGSGAAAQTANFLATRIGLGHSGEDFGEIAYRHDFMGPMTVAPTTLAEDEGKLVLTVNLRRPAGKTRERLEEQIRREVERWKTESGAQAAELTVYIGDPHYLEDAPHVPVLLRVFSHYTGMEDVRPLSAGGGTHARLLPNGVSFGPHMPGRPYSGHTEAEYLSEEELDQDILMYTAMMVELCR